MRSSIDGQLHFPTKCRVCASRLLSSLCIMCALDCAVRQLSMTDRHSPTRLLDSLLLRSSLLLDLETFRCCHSSRDLSTPAAHHCRYRTILQSWKFPNKQVQTGYKIVGYDPILYIATNRISPIVSAPSSYAPLGPLRKVTRTPRTRR